ncbi:MAG: Hpt domain-containing protein [Ruminococcus sp.]|jgi:HPt (histidine-containing phosphotransfer) domain-containing protein|nr:Hpt domain-containing protein [Ruminococcus sp.]
MAKIIKFEYPMLAELEAMGNDISGAVSRMMDNQTLVNKFLIGFPDESRIKNIKKAASTFDYKALEEAVHKIKGTAGNLGLTALYKVASEYTEDVRKKRDRSFPEHTVNLEAEYDKVAAVICKYLEAE